MAVIEESLHTFLKKPDNPTLRRHCFEHIWRTYYSKLRVYLQTGFKIREEELDELVQDIFLQLFKNLHQYSERFSFSTWFYRLARNLSIDTIRKTQGKKVIYLEDFSRFEQVCKDSESTPETIALDKEMKERVRHSLDQLAAVDRQICFFRVYEKMSYKDIASIVELPEGTIKYRFFTAKRTLRRLLEDYYEEQTTEYR